MRRVPLLATLLGLVSFLLPVHSYAAADEGIVLRGNHTAYVDLTVYVNTTVNFADLRMTTKGSYVGFFMSPAPANRDTVGALKMPRVGATGADSASTIKLGQSYDVRAGKYRVFLITNGPAEVFIPITGQGLRGWVPRARAPLAVKPVDFDIAAGSAGATRRMPVALRARSLVVVAGIESSSSLTAVDQVGACVVTDTSDCASTLGADPRLPESSTWTYSAALMPPGSYSGVLSIDRLVGGYDAGSRVDGALLVLTIGVQT